MKRNSRIVLTLLIVCMLVSLLYGCKGNQSENTGNNKSNSNVAAEPLTLPIVKEPITLSCFVAMDQAKIGVTTKNYEDILCYKELEKITGIKIKFLHPPVGQEKEQFNLMIASSDLPDLIYWNFATITGGPQKALDDQIIAPINELVDKYSPNLKSFLDKTPDVKKMLVTDSGQLYEYPHLKYEQSIKTFLGFQLRRDWLEKLNLKAPTTIDEWYTVLKAIKANDLNGNGKADEVPFTTLGVTKGASCGLSAFYAAWGKNLEFYVENGKVKYGAYESQYKDFISTMRKWYQEGLIDQDFASIDSKQRDAKITGNIAGSWWAMLGGDMGRYITGFNNDYNKIIGAQYPVVNKNDKPVNMNGDPVFSGLGAAISTKSKYQKEAAKWLDYHYSKEGSMLLNFGVLGQQYNIVDGKPVFTADILKNEKYSVDVSLGRYAMGASSEAFLQDAGVREVRMWNWPVQKEASLLWNIGDQSKMMPPISPTSQESQRISEIMSEAQTYVFEMFNKFILGQEPIENFDKYVNTLKSLNIEEAIKLQQQALDRYIARK